MSLNESKEALGFFVLFCFFFFFLDGLEKVNVFKLIFLDDPNGILVV